MELRSLARISLPKDEYVYLLGMAISVFISNNGFIIENIINIISRNHTNLTLVLPNLIKYPTSICIYVNINIAIIFIYISFKLLFVKIIYKIIPINT